MHSIIIVITSRVSKIESLPLRKGNKLEVFENRMPSTVTGPTTYKVTGWRKRNNEGLQCPTKEKDIGKGQAGRDEESENLEGTDHLKGLGVCLTGIRTV